MIFVITGNGKGKTTSALGMVSRALGHTLKCAVLQFIKSESPQCGEYTTFSKLGVLWENYGCGFTWQQKDLNDTKLLCVKGWRRFEELSQKGDYVLMILDEFTYAMEEGFFDVENVLDFLKKHYKGKHNVHVVITGRRANRKLIEVADTVSEINETKHHYNSNGNGIVMGIDF